MYGIASGEWSAVVSDLASMLGDRSLDSARMMCDVLCELAEDAREPQLALDAAARARVAAYLSLELPSLLNRMQQTLSASGGHTALQKSALSCLCSWWKNVSWQPPSVLSHPVVDSTFTALMAVELELVASQAVMELIRGVDDFCLPPYQHSAFDYWDDEDGEIRHETARQHGAVPFTLTGEQLAVQQSMVQRVTALVPLYSQMSTMHTTQRDHACHCVSRLVWSQSTTFTLPVC